MGHGRKFFKSESGQAMILFALLFFVLCGMAAFTIDVGRVYIIKGRLQNAADAAALAAAQDLPDTSAAIAAAESYAAQNGADDFTVTCPFNGDSSMIEVVCNETVSYTLARAIGLTAANVSARAVGTYTSQWTGEALPFINLDDDYTDDIEIVAWEKVAPGDFESITNYEIVNPDDPTTVYFNIDYMNGVVLKKGTVATIKQEVGYIFERNSLESPVYILSLKNTVMYSGQVMLTDGTYANLDSLKNGDTVDPSQMVLLQCFFHDYDYIGKTLFLTVLNVYDINSGEFPPDYLNPEGGTARLNG